MEVIAIAVICTVAFGTIATLAVFIHQLITSRNTNLHDNAQQRAISNQIEELRKLRDDMEKNTIRLTPQREIMKDNRDDIAALDKKIAETLEKKSALVHDFAEWALTRSSRLITASSDSNSETTPILSHFGEKTRRDMTFYDREIESLQQRREKLCASNDFISANLLEDQRDYSKNLNTIYQHHSELIDKVNLRYMQNSEAGNQRMVNSSTQLYRTIFTQPFSFFTGLFTRSNNVSSDRASEEINSRDVINRTQRAITNTEINRTALDLEDNSYNTPALPV